MQLFIKLNVNARDDKKCKTCGIKYKGCGCFPGKRSFFNIYKFTNHDINKFILLLSKGVYPYKYMDDWENLIEKNLNMEDIIDEDYRHAKSVCKEFKTRNLGYNNDLYV